MSQQGISGKIHLNPGDQFKTERRLWQGCPTIQYTAKGRLLAGWYSGGMREPDMDNYNLLVKSDDNGLTWSEPILVIESLFYPGLRCIDIQLWRDPTDKIWLFWTQVTGWGQFHPEVHETWAITTTDADADEIIWSEPFFVTVGFLRCKPTVLSDSRWLLPAYVRNTETYVYTETADQGKTWRCCSSGKKIPTIFDESMILEKQDKTLHLYARTLDTGFIAECVSSDQGKTWSEGKNSEFVSPSARFYIGRLASGHILRVNSDHCKERRDLTVWLSVDDGQTWDYSIVLDQRNHVSYPDVTQDDAGNIYIIHDWSRLEEKAILLSRLTEADIKAGGLTGDESFVAKIINQPPRHVLYPR